MGKFMFCYFNELFFRNTVVNGFAEIVVVYKRFNLRINLLSAVGKFAHAGLYTEFFGKLVLPFLRHNFVGNYYQKGTKLVTACKLAYNHTRFDSLAHSYLVGKNTAFIEVENEVVNGFFLI